MGNLGAMWGNRYLVLRRLDPVGSTREAPRGSGSRLSGPSRRRKSHWGFGSMSGLDTRRTTGVASTIETSTLKTIIPMSQSSDEFSSPRIPDCRIG